MDARGDGSVWWRRACVRLAGWLLKVAGETSPPGPLSQGRGGESNPTPGPSPEAERGGFTGGEIAGTIDYRQNTYSKLADGVVSAIGDMMGKRVNGTTVTGSTGWLYACILKRINKRRNTGEMTIEDLMTASGMGRDTVIAHTAVLEALDLVGVTRSRSGPTRNAVNLYRLTGAWAKVALILVESPASRLGESDYPQEGVGSADSSLHMLNNEKEHEEQDVVVVGPDSEQSEKAAGENKDRTADGQDADRDGEDAAAAVAALEQIGVSGAGAMVRMYGASRALAALAAYPGKPKAFIAACIMRPDWVIPSPATQGYEPEDGSKYVTGKYAAFIQH